MKDVVEDLQRHDIPFQLDWLLPFKEFRFSRYGTLQLDNISLELRSAIEPWHVLGEELGSHGTARFIDSSLERVQVKIDGINHERYQLTCNGKRVPLKSTGKSGEFVAGIRYRAWQPPSALHPTIGIHSPLVLDLIDTWQNRAVGGCTYHVVHPGGRAYETFPVNQLEAQSRRINRFQEEGHTPSLTAAQLYGSGHEATRTFFENRYEPHKKPLPTSEPNDDFPHTLDLRYS